MTHKLFLLFTTLIFLATLTFAQDDQNNNGQEKTTEKIKVDDPTDAENDELTIELSEAAILLGGISTSQVSYGRIGETIGLSGEVHFNEDRLVHIAPRFAGIAIKANFHVGDFVQADDIVAIVESNESMNSYSIKSPISGWVIERHITQGEFVSESNSIYVIADLSTVWVNLAVYPKDMNQITKGQTATITAVGAGHKTKGIIEYVTPIIDYKTRSATAKITLENIDNKWRPGTFVQASIVTSEGSEHLIVDKNAVQVLDERNVVFVAISDHKFKAVEVLTGLHDKQFIQILAGLNEGTKYVSNGAFELKAKIVTSNLDAHAGHGH